MDYLVMPFFRSLSCMAASRRALWLAGGVCLATMLASALGCGNNPSKPSQTAKVQQDPEGEFEWAMTRLERALRLNRPTSAKGIVTKRELEHELFPPSEVEPNYTARVTIFSKASFLHGRREVAKKEKEQPEPEPVPLDDPIAPKDDKYVDFVEIPHTGPGAPPVAPPKIETRSLDSKTVAELTYAEGTWELTDLKLFTLTAEGAWELTEQPELKHQQLWFDYAFQ